MAVASSERAWRQGRIPYLERAVTANRNKVSCAMRQAALRGSGRVGRSAAGRAAERAVELAVIASIRHRETDYDALLMRGVDRAEARGRVSARVDDVLERWRRG